MRAVLLSAMLLMGEDADPCPQPSAGERSESMREVDRANREDVRLERALREAARLIEDVGSSRPSAKTLADGLRREADRLVAVWD